MLHSVAFVVSEIVRTCMVRKAILRAKATKKVHTFV